MIRSLSPVDVSAFASVYPDPSRVTDPEVRACYREARRIRARYAAWNACEPHYRIAPGIVACGARPSTARGLPLAAAMSEARALRRGADAGLTCSFDPSADRWDGEDPAPPHVLDAIVRDDSGRVYASLGMIGVNSLDDPYLQTIEAELYAEALDAIAAEAAKRATDDETRAVRIVCGMLRAGRVVIGPEGEILTVSEVRS